MRAQIISDIHTEFHRDYGIKFCEEMPVIAPVLIIAGDFAVQKNMVKNISALCKRFENVIYVFGNHEYYEADRKILHNSIQKLKKRFSNFHYLENDSVEIEGQRFLGATMFFSHHPLNQIYEKRINDFSLIKNFGEWVYERNRETSEYFKDNVKQGDIVITHHSPCDLSIPERFKTSNINRFFVSDQTETIRQNKPLYWIHGHMHDAVNYSLYDTWIISNPFGYISYERTPPIETYAKVIEF